MLSLKCFFFLFFDAASVKPRADDDVPEDVQDNSRYDHIFKHFHNFDKDKEPIQLIHNIHNDSNNSNLALLDLIDYFSKNSSVIPTTEKSISQNKTLAEKREHLNQLLKQLNQFQPTKVEFQEDTEPALTTTSTTLTPLPTLKPATILNSDEVDQRDRYSSYFPEYGDETPIDLKSVLSKEFASYNLSGFYDPYAESKVDLINEEMYKDQISDDQKSVDDIVPQFVDSPQEEDLSSLDETRHNQEDILANDEKRLALPLVGLNSLSKEGQLAAAKLQEDAETINIVVSPTFGVDNKHGGEISIFPQSEMSRLRSNITELTGLDVDRLVEEVSAVVGKINGPLRVQEQHTQITRQEGSPAKYKYTETTAQVLPSDDPADPFIKVLSKNVQNGELSGELGQIINGHNPSSRGEGSGEEVRVNVTTKTNIVNIFTFNIVVANSSGSNFTLDKVSPFKTKIDTTATVDAGPGLNTISVYKYQADDNAVVTKKQSGASTPELEKWLKILLKHQVSGTRGEGSLLQEAVLKDASLLQIPTGNWNEERPFYRKVDEKDSESTTTATTTSKTAIVATTKPKVRRTTESSNIGPLGYTVSQTTTEAPGPMDGIVKFVESMGVGAIPTIFAGAIATYPFWMPLLAGKRRKRETSPKVDIPENWLAYLLGTRFGQNAKLSKKSTAKSAARKTTTTTTTFSTIEGPRLTTTSLAKTTIEGVETARTLYKQFYPSTTTVTSVRQPFKGSGSFSISKLKLAGPPIPSPTPSARTTPITTSRPTIKIQSLMDRWTEMFKSQNSTRNRLTSPTTKSSTTATTILTTPDPMSLSELTLEIDRNEVTLPSNWKPSLSEFQHPLSLNSATQEPIIIGKDVSVSSSTVTEINFEPGKNAPLFTGVKSTEIPPNIWLTAEDLLTAFDNQTDAEKESTVQETDKNKKGVGLEITFIDDPEKSEIKPLLVSISDNEESQIDLLVLKKPENSSLSPSVDPIPIIIPGLPFPSKTIPRRRPTLSWKRPSASKLFIQSFLKEYNKTEKEEGMESLPLKPITLSTFSQIKVREPDATVIKSSKSKATTKPAPTLTFENNENPPIIIKPMSSMVRQIPKEVVINSHTIQTHLTPEIAESIIKNQAAETLAQTENKNFLASYTPFPSTISTPTTTTSPTTGVDPAQPQFGSDFPQDIDPSDVLKLAYGGAFNIQESDDEKEKAIDLLIQQLEREYNNSVNRRASASETETGGKSQSAQFNSFRQQEDNPYTTSKWVYLSGADKIATPLPTGLTPTASNDEILDLIKNMEREVLSKNKTMTKTEVEETLNAVNNEVQVFQHEEVSTKTSIEPEQVFNNAQTFLDGLEESNIPEIIYLNDETMLHFLQEEAAESTNLPEKQYQKENSQEEINQYYETVNDNIAYTITPAQMITLFPIETPTTTSTTTTI